MLDGYTMRPFSEYAGAVCEVCAPSIIVYLALCNQILQDITSLRPLFCVIIIPMKLVEIDVIGL